MTNLQGILWDLAQFGGDQIELGEEKNKSSKQILMWLD